MHFVCFNLFQITILECFIPQETLYTKPSGMTKNFKSNAVVWLEHFPTWKTWRFLSSKHRQLWRDYHVQYFQFSTNVELTKYFALDKN